MIYQASPPKDTLEQGDLLERTPELASLLKIYHPYYADHPENQFFSVLTQSCDLVCRDRAGVCGARYISIAPVRPLSAILKREFHGKLENNSPGARPYASHRVKTAFEQFLQRLFNNNEPSFFFYEADHGSGIPEELCAQLALPISLKPEHYSVFLRAKRAGISDVFQAKLGWLIGQMYSRVGTPDMESGEMSAKIKNYVEGQALWLDESEVKALNGILSQQRAGDDSKVFGQRDIQLALGKIPKRKNQAIDAVLNVAAQLNLVEAIGPTRRSFRLLLEKDPAFAALFPR